MVQPLSSVVHPHMVQPLGTATYGRALGSVVQPHMVQPLGTATYGTALGSVVQPHMVQRRTLWYNQEKGPRLPGWKLAIAVC